MGNIKRDKIELLAPAGGMEQFVAAVENGADAIYIGGKNFNARMNASNFDLKQMKEAISYAHARGVEVFVTMNTLLKNDELYDAVKYAADIYQIGADAAIVQDWGLAVLLKKYVPDLSLHLSTQGSVYNRSGVKNALKMGFERVVIAREMSIDEIREVTDLCDIEVFVHGAMCMCYSGQCQMSRAIGGRSGNRGQCAQPCRLPYTDENGKTGYFLSPKDMCGIERLPELIEADVASLKIEGRMKSPEYVATVTKIYRKYIDMYYKEGRCNVSEEDKKTLMQIFNRGGFSEGYLGGLPKGGLLSGDIPKNSGIYMGKVIGRKDRNLIEAKLSFEPDMGDVIEIRGKNFTGGVITYKEAKGNGHFLIGDIKEEIEKGSDIYRISSAVLMEKARESYRKSLRKRPIGMEFTAHIGEKPELAVYDEDHEVKVAGIDIYERAEKVPTTREVIERQLKKTGDTPFEVEYLSISADEEGRMPVSDINKMRRTALANLEAIICAERKRPDIPDSITIPPLPKEKDVSAITCHSSVTKGNEDAYIKEHLDEKQVVLNNIGWIEEYLEHGTDVYLGRGLNIMNGAAAAYFEGLGAKVAQLSWEATENPEILMVTEHPMTMKTLTDRKGKTYKVEASQFGDKWLIKSVK